MFSRESDGSIFMYNLLIIMLATIFFPKKEWEQNVHNNVLESEFSLCRFFISSLDLEVQWGQRDI